MAKKRPRRTDSSWKTNFIKPPGAQSSQSASGGRVLSEAVESLFESHPFPDSERHALESLGASEADSPIIAAKAKVDAMLIGRPSVRTESVSTTPGEDRIVGVAYGHADTRNMNEPGQLTLNVFVSEPMSTDDVKNTLANAAGVHDETLDQFDPNIEVTGVIETYNNRIPLNPAPCGISIGHYQVTAGTLGALAVGRSGERQNKLFILSNNHVLAAVNKGVVGDSILQPGKFDLASAGRIAILEDFVRLNFGPSTANRVDCAIAWADFDLVNKEFVYTKNGGLQFFQVKSDLVLPRVNTVVGKTGRTTGLTQGTITSIGATIQVGYEGGLTATLVDQIAIVGTNNTIFSQGGDSGSLIWTWGTERNPVGLLAAGGVFEGRQTTFANRIDHVCNELDIDLVT